MIPALRKLREEDAELKDCLSYTVRPCLKRMGGVGVSMGTFFYKMELALLSDLLKRDNLLAEEN